jgi:acetyl esterase/lipase
VRPRNSLSLAERVRATGGQAEVQIYPGLSHIDIALALSRPFRAKLRCSPT